MGENAAADNRTSDYGGNSLSVEGLIERCQNADFNRRMDSYEFAGWILSDAKATDFRLDAVEHFNKFHADKFSETQANEIREIIKAALENREINISEPKEKEPVILNNFIVETSELPPFTDENLINGILKNDRFFKIKREKIAEFFENNFDTEKRQEFMKKVFNADYTELDIGDERVGYKADESGVLMWKGSFLSRTSEP